MEMSTYDWDLGALFIVSLWRTSFVRMTHNFDLKCRMVGEETRQGCDSVVFYSVVFMVSIYASDAVHKDLMPSPLNCMEFIVPLICHSEDPWHTHRLAVELSLPVFKTLVCRDRGSNPDLPHARWTLYLYAAVL